MSLTWRRVLIGIAIVFVLYAVINDPTESADVTNNAWGQITHALTVIGTFFNTLLSH